LPEQGGLSSQYRVAIQETSVKLTKAAYSSMHGLFASSGKVLLSFAYVLYNSASGSDRTVAQVMSFCFFVLLIFETLIFGSRLGSSWRLWKDSFIANQSLYDQLIFVTENWRLNRRENREDVPALKLQETIGKSLVEANDLSMHQNYT